MNLWGDGSRFQHAPSGRWTGTREVLFPAIGQELPSGFEEGCALLAFTLWLSGLLTAIDVASLASTRPPPAPPTRMVSTSIYERVERDSLLSSDQGGAHEAACDPEAGGRHRSGWLGA